MRIPNRTAYVLSKVLVILHWIGAAVLLGYAVYTSVLAADQSDSLQGFIHASTTYGTLSPVRIAICTFLPTFASAVSFVLMALVFRHANHLLKPDANLHCPDSIRRLRKISAYVIACPLLKLLASLIVKILSDDGYYSIHFELPGFFTGMLVICLAQAFISSTPAANTNDI